MTAGFVLVTGASEGLGREFADLAAKSGRGVVLTARRKEKLEDIARALAGTYGVETAVVPADLSRPGEAERLWAEATDGRRIEILVNNAGLGHQGPVGEGDGAREHDSLMVNAVSSTVLLRSAIAHMRENGGGRVLNVSSLAAFMPGPYMAVYHASKAYLLSLSEAVAEELHGSRVSVTALCPGPTATNFFGAAGIEGRTLLSRLPKPGPRAVAEAGWRGMIAGRRVVVPGIGSTLLSLGPRFAPRALVAKIARTLHTTRG